MNVLVIAPHPDDESIGCGGSICLHTDRGDRVAVAFLTSGELGLKHLPGEEAKRIRESEAAAAARQLGMANLFFLRLPDWFVGDNIEQAGAALRPIIEHEAPDLIYLPHAQEWHPDHQASLPVLMEALGSEASANTAPRLLTYEVWTPLAEYSYVEDISAVMQRKIKAVRCYRSQLRGFRYDRAVRGLNQYRGALAAHRLYAEVFGEVDVAPPDDKAL